MATLKTSNQSTEEIIEHDIRAHLIRSLGKPEDFTGWMICIHQSYENSPLQGSLLQQPIESWQDAKRIFEGCIDKGKAEGIVLREERNLSLLNCVCGGELLLDAPLKDGGTIRTTIQYSIKPAFKNCEPGQFFYQNKTAIGFAAISDDGGKTWQPRSLSTTENSQNKETEG
jgi:hypothetical protein